MKSTQEAVSYATLKPQVESVYPATVKEISENVTSLELRYILSAENTDGTKQYYQATEYFRVRYAKDRMYLLNYERNMEAYMRYDTIDRSNNRILLGIGSSQKQLISKMAERKQHSLSKMNCGIMTIRSPTCTKYFLLKEKIIVTVATTIKSMRFRL